MTIKQIPETKLYRGIIYSRTDQYRWMAIFTLICGTKITIYMYTSKGK